LTGDTKRNGPVKLTLSNSDTPDHMPDPLSNHVSNRHVRNAALLAAGALLYWALVSLIPYFSGVNITRITPFFVGAAGYFLGIWAGTGASLAAIVIHTLVFNSLGYEGPFAIAQVKPAAHVGIVLIGPLTGRLRSITLRLQREAAGREAAELELRDSESRLRQIVDTIREAFWIRSADQSRTVYVSPAFESIFGITSDKIENNPRAILEIVHPDDRERLEEKITSIPENDYQLQYRIKRLDGAVRWIQTRAFVVRDEEGKAQRIAGVSMDVTESKHAELALQASEGKYRDLVEKIPAIVYLSHLDLTLPIIYVSPQVEFLLGYSQHEWMSEPDMFGKLYHPDDAHRVKSELARCIRLSKRFVADFRMITKTGAVRWFHAEADIDRDENGEPMFLQGVMYDITQRRYTEATQRGRGTVLEKLAAGASLADVLTTLIKFTEELVLESACAIAVLDHESNVGYYGASDNLPAEIVEIAVHERPSPDSSCIGRAIHAGERAVVADVGQSSLDEKFREWAASTGVRACWAEPIRSSRGEMLGALSIYIKKTVEPSPQDDELLKSVADLASIAIEQRQTEEALRENEEKLRLFVHHNPAAVAMFDDEMRYLVVSEKWHEVHELDNTDIIGKSHYDVLPNLPERWKETHRRCLAGAIEKNDGDRVVRPDGEIDWVKWAIHPWRRPDGDIGGVIIFTEFVTEQKWAQKRLKRSEEQYRFLVEHMPDAITELDADGNILFANRVVLGDSIADVIGTPIYDHLPEQRRDEFRHVLTDVVKARQPRDFSVPIPTMDGTTWWSNRVVPIEENGTVVRLLVIGNDVTARKSAEDALRRSENRYRKLFEDDLSGDFVATPGGNLITCNHAFVRIFGFESVDEALSVNISSLFPTENAWNEFTGLLAVEGRMVDDEEKLRSASGKAVYVVANFVGGFDGEGNLTEIKGYLFDNTARKRLEEQLIQAQKMEAVGRLAGGIAHDFNNSLTSISGYNELLINKLDADSPLYRYAREVMKAADRAAGLTKRLLAFSRQQMIQPKVIDLNTIVNNMETVLRRTIGEDVELETETGADHCVIEADPTLIETVILNLAINARDAMPDGGRLTIHTGVTKLERDDQLNSPGIEPGKYCVISIVDTGVGMDDDTKAGIFEPFFTTKKQGTGTGLGLSTVYGAVRQSGGHVLVSSQPGRGATFRLFFPVVEDRMPASTTREMFLGPSRGSETVLVAEDEPTVQRLIRDVLQNKGYRVLSAGDGDAALEVAAAEGGKIDLLITDVVMPRMNGRELANEIQARNPLLKVLFISGYIGKSSVKIAELGPGTSFLSKPFSSEALARKIRLLLDSPPHDRTGREPRSTARPRTFHHPF
jgi:PAS domain S-box-containing protein